MAATVVTLVLDYDCGTCGLPIAATLRCEGDLEGQTANARVALDCPHCKRTSDVVFDAEGAVLEVRTRPRRPEICWN